MSNIYINYDEILDSVGYILENLESLEIDEVWAIERGGLIPGVHLSHALKVPLKIVSKNQVNFPYSPDVKKKILLVDDINDTGTTFVNLMRNMLNDGVNLDDVTLCALYQKKTSDIEVDVYGFITGDEWLVFPWEHTEPELPTQDENQTVYYWCFNFDKPDE